MTNLNFVLNTLAAIKAAGAGVNSPLTRLKSIAGTAAANNTSDILLQCTYANRETRACCVSQPVPVTRLHDNSTGYLGELLVSEIGDRLTILSRKRFDEL
jgi:hypothetical protein